MKQITILSLLTYFLLLPPAFAKKETIKYPASAIPAKLKKNANAVVRLDEAEFSVHSPKSSRLTQKW